MASSSTRRIAPTQFRALLRRRARVAKRAAWNAPRVLQGLVTEMRLAIATTILTANVGSCPASMNARVPPENADSVDPGMCLDTWKYCRVGRDGYRWRTLDKSRSRYSRGSGLVPEGRPPSKHLHGPVPLLRHADRAHLQGSAVGFPEYRPMPTTGRKSSQAATSPPHQ